MNEKNTINFYQGTTNLLSEKEDLEKIKEKIAEFSNIKNIHFLLGAGTSFETIPDMKKMKEELEENLKNENKLKTLYEKFLNKKNDNNLEVLLGVMYAKQYYSKRVEEETKYIDNLIEYIEKFIYKRINIDFDDENSTAREKLNLYKSFYQKIVLRNKDLARVNIFTTNNDLFNEKALDDLNINYNNGFGGGLEKVFNPARFRYTFSQKIDANLEKFEPLENMVYLYKLHGSVSWIKKEDNSLFDIQEITVKGGEEKPEKSVLIYPTPLKQGQSLGSPYADLIREFQTKLCQSNSVLFVIGYSFSDEHVNDIVYQSLASNASLSIVIFGECESCRLIKINDSRIYRIFGNDGSQKIHYFQYIVESLLPNLDENKEKSLLANFVKAIKEENTKKT